MFEKEAEEYATENWEYYEEGQNDSKVLKQAFLTGAEFGYRMLQPNELAAATGFPPDYKFTGTKVEVVKQIGNAVPPNFAKAIFKQILKETVSVA